MKLSVFSRPFRIPDIERNRIIAAQPASVPLAAIRDAATVTLQIRVGHRNLVDPFLVLLAAVRAHGCTSLARARAETQMSDSAADSIRIS
jgi:hypothetical protein